MSYGNKTRSATSWKGGGLAVALVVVGAWTAAPALAENVYAGSDLFVTPGLYGAPTPTYDDLAGDPIPADFFGPGSDPFDGIIYFVGQPLYGTGLPPDTDAIVTRLQDAYLPDPYNSEATVDTEMVALNLVSSMPITVTFNGGTEWATYDVQACLSSDVPQPPGEMTIRHRCDYGGSFDSITRVVPKLNFTKVSGYPGVGYATLDPAPQLDFTVTNGCWSHHDPGFGIYTSGGGTVDHDCDGIDDVMYMPTSNFFIGVCWLPCDGSGSAPEEPRKRMTPEMELLAAHGVLPPEESGSDSDGDGFHDGADNCPFDHNPLQEDVDNDTVGDICDNCPDDYNPFQEDSNGNGIGDACEGDPGDNCSFPLEVALVPGYTFYDTNTTCGRGNNYQYTCLGDYDGGEDIIYELTTSVDMLVNITLDPKGMTWTGLALDDTCPPDDICLAMNTNTGGDPYDTGCIDLEAGTTYYIMIDNWPSPDCIPEFDLIIEECADCIPPGEDCWSTVCDGKTKADFADNPIPADFFDPGSEPFDGVIELGGASGFVDTIVARLEQMCFSGIPSTDTAVVQLVHLDLVSCAPITVTGSGEWDVQVGLSSVEPDFGTLAATKTHENGGTFTVDFYVQPVYTFTRVDPPHDTRIFDTGLEGIPPILMQTTGDAPWSTNELYEVCTLDGFAAGVQEQLGEPCGTEVCHSSFGTAPHEHCARPTNYPPCEEIDYFTELFDDGDNDLDYLSLVFVPDGSASYYTGCVETIASLPTDPAGGTALTLSDDDSVAVTISGTVSLYGVSYSTFYVGSNGYITFTVGDTGYTESLTEHFRLPRISGLFDDLSPNVDGTVSYEELADRVAVTWENVPEYNTTNQNTFQIEMYYDGQITISYLNLDALDGLVGLSEGLGEPFGFEETDLSAMDPCEADCILPGIDCWWTECGDTMASFASTPIPADFFEPGSEPFDGTVALKGASGLIDTVVERFEQMCFTEPWPSTAQTAIQLVQLDLVSCEPITVIGSGDWDVAVGLSGVPTPDGLMTVTKTHENGGVFDSSFYVQPVYVFTRVDPPHDTRTFDTGLEGFPPILMQTIGEAPWSADEVFDLCTIDGFHAGAYTNPDGVTCCEEVCHESPSDEHLHCTIPPECPPCVCPGDSNCDEAINWRDIDFFVAAMNDNVAAWEAMFLPGVPTCPFANNDVNGDGTVNWRDIDPFVAVMNTTCP
ncbi:MAG: thrombospondin type 3 repeat-containing protein [Phycisphaerae bacterium]|nr:thrombospondin type 3 repeat-containing protein [Phycisphaerae bacterium]